MVVCDAITFNQDRHFGNFGVLIDNDTVTPLRMAPVFDFNLAFLPYVVDSEFEHIGDKLLEYGPKIGEDFTRIGQKMLTDRIADKLKDVTFSAINDRAWSFQPFLPICTELTPSPQGGSRGPATYRVWAVVLQHSQCFHRLY